MGPRGIWGTPHSVIPSEVPGIDWNVWHQV